MWQYASTASGVQAASSAAAADYAYVSTEGRGSDHDADRVVAVVSASMASSRHDARSVMVWGYASMEGCGITARIAAAVVHVSMPGSGPNAKSVTAGGTGATHGPQTTETIIYFY
jgi:hypothetical protein